MEGYLDDEELVQELEDDDEDLPISVSDITFNKISLEEYEEMFTKKLPAIPCTSQEILGAISELANAYQLAYNCSSRLIVIVAKSEKDYKIKRNQLVSAKITALKALTPGKATKLPARDTIEGMVIEESTELSSLVSQWKKWCMLKEWFESHVKKLSQMLTAAKDISYSINNNERMYSKGNV